MEPTFNLGDGQVRLVINGDDAFLIGEVLPPGLWATWPSAVTT